MKKTILSTILSILTIGLMAQEPSETLKNISTKLDTYSQNLTLEKIFIQTDKDVYNPGEIIWFKAFVFDRSTQKLSKLSKELIIKLFDNKGNIVSSDYYILKNGQTNGDLKLPGDLQRGRYYLSAYTPLQFSIENTFNRLILVDQIYKSDLIVNNLNKDEIFDANQKNANVFLEVKSLMNEPEPRIKLNYEIYFGENQIDDGRVRTDTDGKAEIEFKLPNECGKLPMRMIVWEDKNYWEKTFLIKTSNDQVDIKFYPEGGNAITGLPQKTGFVSKDIFGNPISISGDIIDNQGNIITKSKSFTDGFGLIPVQYNAENNLQFKITSEYGKGQVFNLPIPDKNNFTIAVLNTDENFINTYLSCNEGENHNIILVLTSGYQLVWAGEMAISKPARIKIPLNECPDGIASLSAFNHENKLIGQRLINIDRSQKLNINVKTNVRNNIESEVSVSDKNNAQINGISIVSVGAENCFLNNENNLYQSLKFNSELKNKITDQSLTDPENIRNKTLIDYILITNNLKGFSWNNILTFDASEIKYVKNNLLGLTGKVTGKYNEAIPNAKVNVLDSRNMNMVTQTTNKNGEFLFLSLNPSDIDNFTITATGADGKKEYNAEAIKSFEEQLGKHICKLDLLNSDAEVSREKMADFIQLNEQYILNAPAKPVQIRRQYNEPAYKELLKSSTSLLDVIKAIKPFQLSGDAIIFPGMFNSVNSQIGAIIVVDGQNLGKSSSILDNYNPLDIDEINVYTDPVNSQKYTSFASGGLIEIFTKSGETTSKQTKKEKPEENLYMNGYRIPREYNSVMNLISVEEDKLKTTLFWNPDLKVEAGKTDKLNISPSALKTGYIIRVTVLDNQGRSGIIQQIISE